MKSYRPRNERFLIDLPGSGFFPVAMTYANTYPVAMSSLGFQHVLRLFAEAGTQVERVCISGQLGAPQSLETGRPLAAFPLVAVSLNYELDVFHLVRMLVESGIPPLAKDRGPNDPIVVVGGVAPTAHPAIVEDIADAVALGEAEGIVGPMIMALRETLDDRDAALQALDAVPHLYLPILGAKERFERDEPFRLPNLAGTPCHSIGITTEDQFGGAFLLEVSRGCSHRCKFCVISYAVGGWRFRPASELKETIDTFRPGIHKVGLLGAAVADHPELDELAAFLVERGLSFSTSSLRADRLSDSFLRMLKRGGNNTITLAPETGDEARRQEVGKRMSDDAILDVAERAGRMRFQKLKLYWVVGMPGEDLDVEMSSLIQMSREIESAFTRSGGGQVVCSVSPFVPKAYTPYADAPQPTPKAMRRVQRRIRRELAFRGRIKVPPHSVWEAHIEGALSVLPRELLTPRLLRVGRDGEEARAVFLETEVAERLAAPR